MAGAFNFDLDLSEPLPNALSWREYDEWNKLKATRQYPQTRERVDQGAIDAILDRIVEGSIPDE